MEIIYPASIDDYLVISDLDTFIVDDLIHFMNNLSADFVDIDLGVSLLRAVHTFPKNALSSISIPSHTQNSPFALWFYCHLGILCISNKKLSAQIAESVANQLSRELSDSEQSYLFDYLFQLFNKFDAKNLENCPEISLSPEFLIKFLQSFNSPPKNIVSWIDHSFHSLTNFTISVQILTPQKILKNLSKLSIERQSEFFILFPETKNDVASLNFVLNSEISEDQKLQQIRYFWQKSPQKTLKMLQNVNFEIFSSKNGHFLVFEIFQDLILTKNLILIKNAMKFLENYLQISDEIFSKIHQIASFLVELEYFKKNAPIFMQILLKFRFKKLNEAFSLFNSLPKNSQESKKNSILKFINENFDTNFPEIDNFERFDREIVTDFNLILHSQENLDDFAFGFLQIHHFIAKNAENCHFLENEKIPIIPKFLFEFENRIPQKIIEKIAERVLISPEIEFASLNFTNLSTFNIFVKIYKNLSSEKLLNLAQKMAAASLTIPTLIALKAISSDFLAQTPNFVQEILLKIDLKEVAFFGEIFENFKFDAQKIINLTENLGNDFLSSLIFVNLILSIKSENSPETLKNGVKILEFLMEIRGDLFVLISSLIFFEKITFKIFKESQKELQNIEYLDLIRREVSNLKLFKTIFSADFEIISWFQDKKPFPKSMIEAVPFFYKLYPTKLMKEYDDLVAETDNLQLFLMYLTEISNKQILLTDQRIELIKSKSALFPEFLWKFEDLLSDYSVKLLE